MSSPKKDLEEDLKDYHKDLQMDLKSYKQAKIDVAKARVRVSDTIKALKLETGKDYVYSIEDAKELYYKTHTCLSHIDDDEEAKIDGWIEETGLIVLELQ